MLLLGNPLAQLLTRPWVRPFRWSSLLWTYAIPAAPAVVAWDGFVSGLRLYSVGQLRAIVQALPANDYDWEIGAEPFPRSITYLIGYPPSPASRGAEQTPNATGTAPLAP